MMLSIVNRCRHSHVYLMMSSMCVINLLAYNVINCDDNDTVDINSKRTTYKLSTSEHIIIHPFSSSSSSSSLSSPSVKPSASLSPSLVIMYDKRTRSPKYVIEHLTFFDLLCDDNEEAAILKKKRKPFYSEPTILNDLFKVSQ